MPHDRPRIIIADDHVFVADACKKLLEPEFDVVATIGDGRALVRIAATLKPQVIVVDIGMPLLNGLDAGQQIKQRLRSVKLVFLTMNTDSVLAGEAFRRGASGYLLKSSSASELNSCRAGGPEGQLVSVPGSHQRNARSLVVPSQGYRRRATAYRTPTRSSAVANRGKVDEGGRLHAESYSGYDCRS